MPSCCQIMASFVRPMKAADLPGGVIRNFDHNYCNIWVRETDIIIRQSGHSDEGMSIFFMNSFSTHEDQVQIQGPVQV